MSFRVHSFVHFICHMVIIFFLTNHEYLIDINNINMRIVLKLEIEQYPFEQKQKYLFL